MSLGPITETQKPPQAEGITQTGSARQYALDHLLNPSRTRIEKKPLLEFLGTGHYANLVLERTFAIKSSPESELNLHELSQITNSTHGLTIRLTAQCDGLHQVVPQAIIDCRLFGKDGRHYQLLPDGSIRQLSRGDQGPSFDFTNLLRYVDTDFAAEAAG